MLDKANAEAAMLFAIEADVADEELAVEVTVVVRADSEVKVDNTVELTRLEVLVTMEEENEEEEETMLDDTSEDEAALEDEDCTLDDFAEVLWAELDAEVVGAL